MMMMMKCYFTPLIWNVKFFGVFLPVVGACVVEFVMRCALLDNNSNAPFKVTR